LVVCLAMMTTFSRNFAWRIAVMTGNVARLAKGEPLAAPLKGSDELSRLDASFHGMARALTEKDQENEMFIYSVSHDLRSPLVNLQGFSKELALTRADLREVLSHADVSPDVRRRVETLLARDMDPSIRFIQSAVARMSGIIDSLLRLSRAGRVVYRRQEVDVQSTVERVVEVLRGTAAQRRAEVVVHELPPAWGDPTAVEQMFANLLGNALAYLDPDRPGRVEVGTRDGDAKAPGLTTYYVKDNGLGIPQAHQSKLFLAFQRLHPTAAPGEGIGLALVKRLAERQGGKVWAESEEGKGSSFLVALPAARGDGPGIDMALVTPPQGTRLPAGEFQAWPPNL
jgi:signal transduction histidine kinase